MKANVAILSLIAVTLGTLFIDGDHYVSASKQKATFVFQLCQRRVDFESIYHLVDSSISENLHHKLLTAAIVAVEMANRNKVQRELEYQIIKTCIKHQVFKNWVLNRTLGIGQISIRNALESYQRIDLSNSNPNWTLLRRTLDLIMNHRSSIEIVSSQIIQIKRENGLNCETNDGIKQIANIYYGFEKEASVNSILYGDVVLLIVQYLHKLNEAPLGYYFE